MLLALQNENMWLIEKINQLRAEIILLQEKIEQNNKKIYQICDHIWERDPYASDHCGSRRQICRFCNLEK